MACARCGCMAAYNSRVQPMVRSESAESAHALEIRKCRHNWPELMWSQPTHLSCGPVSRPHLPADHERSVEPVSRVEQQGRPTLSTACKSPPEQEHIRSLHGAPALH